MIKIFISVRNRLSILKKCVEAIIRHSEYPNQIYIYDNLTNYRVREHFEYAYNLYKHDIVSQYTFNTKDSTFDAFSKVVSCNQFGQLHLNDPNKDKYWFLLILDNDVIVMPRFDAILRQAWKDVKQLRLDNIKVIGQLPGGIKASKILDKPIAGYSNCKIGKFGGSGFWSVRPDFFSQVGLLEVKKLVGQDKKHDQTYWHQLDKASKGQSYILGISEKLGVHCGKYAGSICNTLVRHKNKKELEEMIKFKKAEDDIDSLSFDEFFEKIKSDTKLLKDW